jgi:uncharacterized protein (TIGR02246 family)
MNARSLLMTGGALAALAAGVLLVGRLPAPVQGQPPANSDDRAADRKAIADASKAFEAAFEKGDAKAVAGFWTEAGEYESDTGEIFRGRSVIEAAFAAHFKAVPKSQCTVRIDSIRFPSRDLAIEEGLLTTAGAGRELPASTRYRVVHVREGGTWKIALAREWGAGQDRLEDIAWLIGDWKGTGKDKDREVTLTIRPDAVKTYLVGRITAKVKGEVASTGTMKIGVDPQRGQLRSWHFEDDGGHGQALWIRDGSRWVLDAIGVAGNGSPTAAVNLLGRIDNDTVTWRSIDRVMAGQKMPDSPPIRLTRVNESK